MELDKICDKYTTSCERAAILLETYAPILRV